MWVEARLRGLPVMERFFGVRKMKGFIEIFVMV